MTKHLLAASLCALVGCHERWLEVEGLTVPLGEGLEADYQVNVSTCESLDDGCWSDYALITGLRSRGPISVARDPRTSWGFLAFGAAPGMAEVAVDAEEYSGVFDFEVRPVVYSELDWYDVHVHRIGPLQDASLQVEQIGPAFAATEIKLNQMHYRKTRAELASILADDYNMNIYVRGTTSWRLDRGETDASLMEVPAPLPRRSHTILRTGAVLGAAALTTHVGGELAVDIVDARAIRSLIALDEYGRRIDAAVWASAPFRHLDVVPLDADGRAIAGCPAAGPEVFDDAGMFEVTRSTEAVTPFCAFSFKWPVGTEWTARAIVVRWNGAELRIPVALD